MHIFNKLFIKKIIQLNRSKLKMRAFDSVILKSKMEEFIEQSRKNIDNKIKKIINFMLLMKDENDNIIAQSN